MRAEFVVSISDFISSGAQESDEVFESVSVVMSAKSSDVALDGGLSDESVLIDE